VQIKKGVLFHILAVAAKGLEYDGVSGAIGGKGKGSNGFCGEHLCRHRNFAFTHKKLSYTCIKVESEF
jgi:hypothetical protein